MTREEILKHPDYMYVPVDWELDHPEATVAHVVQKSVGGYEDYAQAKYGTTLADAMKARGGRLIVQVLDGHKAGFDDVVRIELSNEEWFRKEVLGE